MKVESAKFVIRIRKNNRIAQKKAFHNFSINDFAYEQLKLELEFFI